MVHSENGTFPAQEDVHFAIARARRTIRAACYPPLQLSESVEKGWCNYIKARLAITDSTREKQVPPGAKDGWRFSFRPSFFFAKTLTHLSEGKFSGKLISLGEKNRRRVQLRTISVHRNKRSSPRSRAVIHSRLASGKKKRRLSRRCDNTHRRCCGRARIPFPRRRVFMHELPLRAGKNERSRRDYAQARASACGRAYTRSAAPIYSLITCISARPARAAPRSLQWNAIAAAAAAL